jgi:hypothetical protein
VSDARYVLRHEHRPSYTLVFTNILWPGDGRILVRSDGTVTVSPGARPEWVTYATEGAGAVNLAAAIAAGTRLRP